MNLLSNPIMFLLNQCKEKLYVLPMNASASAV